MYSDNDTFRWVSPFGNLRIKAYLPAPRSLSQAQCHTGLFTYGAITHYGRPFQSVPLSLVLSLAGSSNFARHYFRNLFSPFPHGTCSLSVDDEYLALEHGPPMFRQDYTCPALLFASSVPHRSKKQKCTIEQFNKPRTKDRKSTRLNSSHSAKSRMPSSA